MTVGGRGKCQVPLQASASLTVPFILRSPNRAPGPQELDEGLLHEQLFPRKLALGKCNESTCLPAKHKHSLLSHDSWYDATFHSFKTFAGYLRQVPGTVLVIKEARREPLLSTSACDELRDECADQLRIQREVLGQKWALGPVACRRKGHNPEPNRVQNVR